MITKTGSSLQRSSSSDNWQTELANAIREPEALLEALDLPVSLLGPARQAATRFPLRVTQSYLSRIEPGNPNDPLLRQILPIADELDAKDWGQLDPVGDHQAMPSPGLLHKYQGRALLVSTAACAIHCRYCFRQHFPYQQANPLGTQWPATLAYLKQHPDISEVILSGGDPLSLGDEKLAKLVTQLETIEHIKTLRLHSRLPVVLPSRITSNLINWLRNSRFQMVLVLHINHPNEINQEVMEALEPLRDLPLTLLNQAVLLKGINDQLETQVELSQRLFQAGILPYYLHQLDPVSGAAHFAVSVQNGLSLMSELQNHLPGYLVPNYVQEIAGSASKIPLTQP